MLHVAIWLAVFVLAFVASLNYFFVIAHVSPHPAATASDLPAGEVSLYLPNLCRYQCPEGEVTDGNSMQARNLKAVRSPCGRVTVAQRFVLS